MSDKLISKIPDGPLAEKWTKRKSELHLVNPNNRRKLEVIVVGTGLGLSIVKGVLQMHHARFGVETDDREEHHGSNFWFELEVADADHT